MKKLLQFDAPSAFRAAAYDTLMTQEVQNNLMLRFSQTPDAKAAGWFLAIIYDEAGAPSLVAAMTPPFNMVLFAVGSVIDTQALFALAAHLKAHAWAVPGVLAETKLAYAFADAMGVAYEKADDELIMQCDAVRPVKPAAGGLRHATRQDLYFLPYWLAAFGVDCRLSEAECSLARQIEGLQNMDEASLRHIYLWQDEGVPVAMARIGRSTENGAGITHVYTPPMYRNRGYAQALVAQASQIGLNSGKRFCFLFADANNPVSCGIYWKMGYRAVCSYTKLWFLTDR
ncbi:MAG: GNAT family N-acetyltransferase [Oscillospiraceae bacterium]|jgi:predicted GNAT family acetyltransferase|nr:GNAT family N-acetyltransferase [Oscillospiraceae bacterium]